MDSDNRALGVLGVVRELPPSWPWGADPMQLYHATPLSLAPSLSVKLHTCEAEHAAAKEVYEHESQAQLASASFQSSRAASHDRQGRYGWCKSKRRRVMMRKL